MQEVHTQTHYSSMVKRETENFESIKKEVIDVHESLSNIERLFVTRNHGGQKVMGLYTQSVERKSVKQEFYTWSSYLSKMKWIFRHFQKNKN